MTLLLTILVLTTLVMAPAATAQSDEYGWTISTGVFSTQFDILESAGAGAPTGFTPERGVLNVGTATELSLFFGNCPVGPFLVGTFSVAPDAFIPDIDLCIMPSAATGTNVSVDCMNFIECNNAVIGFRKLVGQPGGPCVVEGCVPVSVEGTSFGAIKGGYRE